MPGFSETWIAAARPSWLALPVTRLSNVNAGFRRARSSVCGILGAEEEAAAGAEVLAAVGVA